jgi:hypothetical protein
MKEGLREYLCTVTMGLLISVSNFATATGAESTFKECCGKCHVRPASVVRGLKGNTEEQRRNALDQFLSTHHAEDPEVRAEIIGYLLELASK